MKTRKRVQYSSDKPSRTQQHMKKLTDVNSIIEKYRATGHFNHTKTSPGQYGDFSQFSDFRTAMTQVINAQNSFDALPAHLRKRFANDPAELIEFLDDSSNLQEAISLGLAVPKAETQSPENDDKTTKTPENPQA